MSEVSEGRSPRRGLLALAAVGTAGLATFAGSRPAAAEPAAGTGPFDGVVNSVTSFGATGDGTTDDTSALQQAIAATPPGGGVYFPPGTYVISKTLRPKSKQVFFGTGDAVIKSANGSFVMFVCKEGPVEFRHLSFDGLKAHSDSPAQPSVVRVILVQGSSDAPVDLTVSDCYVTGAWGNGIETVGTGGSTDRVWISGTAVEDCGLYGIQFRSTSNAHVSDCLLRNNRHGLGGDEVHGASIDRCRFEGNARHGAVFVYSSDWQITNCHSVQNGLIMSGGWGITAGGLYRDPFPQPNHDFVIANNTCVGNGAGGITVDPAVRQEMDVIQMQSAVLSGNVCVGAVNAHGINITHARDVVVNNNVCRNNPITGIQISSSSHVTAQGNLCTKNKYGIGLSSNTVVKDPGHHVIGINNLYQNSAEDLYHEVYEGVYPLTGVRHYGLHGTTEPEGNVLANPGTVYERHGDPTSNDRPGVLYVKVSGEHNTKGWRRVVTAGG